MQSIIQQLKADGFELDHIIADGKLHRVGPDSKKSQWYVCFLNYTRKAGEQFYVIAYGDWRTGESHTFNTHTETLSPEDRGAIKKQIVDARRKNEESRKRQQEEASEEVREKWETLSEHGSSPYLQRKKVGSYGCRFSEMDLYVPLRDGSGKLWSLQKINDGNKYFYPGGRVQGCFHTIEGNTNCIYITEGYATGATVHECSGETTVIAFNASNLLAVATDIREKYPDTPIIIAGDDDRTREGNPGRTKAEEAATRVGGKSLFPKFRAGSTGSDFNDLLIQEGPEEVATQLSNMQVQVQEEAQPVSQDYVVNHQYPDEDEKGARRGTIANLITMLNRLKVVVRYNRISKQEERIIPGLVTSLDNNSNVTWATIISWCERCKIPVGNIKSYLTAIADANQYDPVQTWIQSEPWDGVSRLEDLYDTIKSKNDPLKKILIRKWLISAVAAAYEPDGVSAGGVLVLQGKQYLGKTMWFRKLVPPELELTMEAAILRPDDKDLVFQCISKWIVELGELDATFKKADIAQLKAFITKKQDVLRRPFAQDESHYARRTVFFASVNDDKYLNDPTGNRRFWTIECIKLDYDHQINMQQLWAEVATLYHAKQRWHLTPEENEMLTVHNESFQAIDPVEERIRTGFPWEKPFCDFAPLTASQVCREIGILNPTQHDTRVASRVLKSLCHSFQSKGYTVFSIPRVKDKINE